VLSVNRIENRNTRALVANNKTQRIRTRRVETFTNGNNKVDIRQFRDNDGKMKFTTNVNGREYCRQDRYQIASILHRAGFRRFETDSV
jgi:hypothetical protein